MSANWRRWIKYGKAKLDSTIDAGEQELDRREAQLEADAADKPWLTSTGPAPTFDEAKARIEHMAREAGAASAPAADDAGSPPGPPPVPGGAAPAAGPAGPPASDRATGSEVDMVDMAARQKAAEERLATIREELGLGDADAAPPPAPAAPESP